MLKLNYEKRQAGFTIVELLVVIVVIAILATISVVVYRGIQDRATLSKATQEVRKSSTNIALYRAESDKYPGLLSSDNPAGLMVVDPGILKEIAYCSDDDSYLLMVKTLQDKWYSMKTGSSLIPVVVGGQQACLDQGYTLVYGGGGAIYSRNGQST